MKTIPIHIKEKMETFSFFYQVKKKLNIVVYESNKK